LCEFADACGKPVITSAKKKLFLKASDKYIIMPVNPYLSIGHNRDRIDHCNVTIYTILNNIDTYKMFRKYSVINKIMQLVIVIVIEVG